MFENRRKKSFAFQPTAVGVTQTKDLYPVSKGDRIYTASLKRTISAAGSTSSTFEVRVSAAAGGASAGLIGATDTEGAVGSLVNGAGADLATGSFLCTADGTLQITYTATTPGATNPACEVGFIIGRDPLVNGV